MILYCDMAILLPSSFIETCAQYLANAFAPELLQNFVVSVKERERDLVIHHQNFTILKNHDDERSYTLHFFQSVIIPVHNAEPWMSECLASLSCQQKPHHLHVEVSLFLDSCHDDSLNIVCDWTPKLQELGYTVTVTQEDNEYPKGGTLHYNGVTSL